MTSPNPLIIYHANCIDGYSAAWIAYKSILKSDGVKCELFSAKYGDPVPIELATNRRVLIFDYSYPKEDMIGLYEFAAMLEVFDHHKTAKDNCKGLDFCTFDMEKSGSRLAWEYFHPDLLAPDWLIRVDDRDLWNFNYQDTKRVHAYIASLPMTIENWNELDGMLHYTIQGAGEHILRYVNISIRKALKEARTITLDDNLVTVLNTPRLNASETATELLCAHNLCLYSMTYYQQHNGA